MRTIANVFQPMRNEWKKKDTKMVLTQQSFYLLDAGAVCAIFLLNSPQCIGLSLLLQRYGRKGYDGKNKATLRFFFISIRTQLNAVHVHVHA